MNHYVVLGIFGIISGIAASLADVPLARPGKANPGETLPLNGISPWWADVTDSRFIVSFWLSFLGQPGAYVTMWLLADLISRQNNALALALRIVTFIACYTGLICHAVFGIKPVLYRKLCKKMSDDESLKVINSIDPFMKAPMLIGALALWLGSTVIVAAAIVTGALNVPKICFLLNPVGAFLVLFPLKKLGVKISGVLGAGFILLSVLLIIAGVL
jgi:hypothetical protein